MEKDGLSEGKYKLKYKHEEVSMEKKESKINLGKISERAILIAEDNRQNQRVIQILINQKYPLLELFFVSNGKELLEEMDQQEYDLILLDIGMPVMDGYQAVRKIRENGSDIPVVALTANAMGEDEQKCLEAGCDGYISKPIDVKKLHSVIDRYLA